MQKFATSLFGFLVLVGTNASAADLSIFNQGASVVTERQSFDLQAGSQVLAWPGLPDQILPETLLLQSEGVRLIGSRYLRDTLNQQSLLERREGQRVTLLREDGQGGDIEREALLISARGAPIVRVDDRIETLDSNSPWRIALSQLPPALPASPSLSLQIAAEAAGEQPLRLTYQVSGLQWSGEYVARYDDAAKQMTLNAQAVLRNNSGGDFEDAKVDLVAGDIARANSGGGPRPVMMRSEKAFASADSGPSASQAFEYYRYELPQAIDLANGETRSVNLFQSQTFAVKREYRIENGYRSINGVPTANAQIHVSFKNSLGNPLPAGTVRVYDSADSPLLLGEDNIEHTTENQPVGLTLGRAFDITAERRVTENNRDGQTRTSERRIVVSNAKENSVQVKLIERLPGDWEITSESAPHNKLDANRAVWTVGVPAGGKAVLNYSLRYR